MGNILKVTREEEPDLFELIGEFITNEASSAHRRGSSFIVESIVEFKEEHKQFFREYEDFELKCIDKYIGLWKTNAYVCDEVENGFEDICSLVRVEEIEKEVLVKVVEWVLIKE
jgi:hypothetical protein